MTPTYRERMLLADEVFHAAFIRCESFREGDIGADLAYLLGAIINCTKEECSVDWCAEEYSGGDDLPALLPILKDAFKPDHAVWNYIILD